MACKRCGQCCTTVQFVLGGVVLDQDTQGFAQYVAAHHCQVFGVKLEDGGPVVMAVKIPLTCKHLKFDGMSGITSCAIYDIRPHFCREHFCKAAKEEEECHA